MNGTKKISFQIWRGLLAETRTFQSTANRKFPKLSWNES
jgi:hypothetical protein